MNLCIVAEDQKDMPIEMMYLATQVMVDGALVKNKLMPDEVCDIIVKVYIRCGYCFLDIVSVKQVTLEKMQILQRLYKICNRQNELRPRTLLTL